MSKGKILYISSTLGNTSPVKNVLYPLVSYMVSQKWTVEVLTLSPEPESSLWRNFAELDITLKSLNMSRSGFYLHGGHRRLLEVVSDFKPDIVHANCFRSIIYASSLAQKYNVCATIHGYPDVDFRMTYGRIIGSLMASMYVRALRSEHSIACGKALAEHMEKKYVLCCEYIRNGTDVDYWSYRLGEQNELRRQLGLPRDRQLIITSGVTEGKNPIFIIDSLQDLLNSGQVTLVILGDGSLLDECRTRSKIQAGLICTGRVEDIRPYLQAADMYVSASYGEGFPVAVVEAMAAGLPVVLSDIGPHREVHDLEPGAGLCYRLDDSRDFADKVGKVLRDLPIYAKFASTCAHTYLTKERMVAGYYDKYQQLSV